MPALGVLSNTSTERNSRRMDVSDSSEVNCGKPFGRLSLTRMGRLYVFFDSGRGSALDYPVRRCIGRGFRTIRGRDTASRDLSASSVECIALLRMFGFLGDDSRVDFLVGRAFARRGGETVSVQHEQVGMITPSLLAYLFPDEIVHGKSMKFVGTTYPCRNTAINDKELAVILFSLAFWNLQDEGVVKLDYVEKKSLRIFTVRSVNVTLLHQSPRHGLEQGILDQLQKSQTRTAQQIVHDWYGRDDDNAPKVVTNALQQHGVDSGLLRVVDSGHGTVGKLVFGKTKVEWLCDTIATQHQNFLTMKQSWNQFQGNNPLLAKQLLNQVETAIESRQIRDDKYENN